jgi:hypothetical protein
MCWLSNQTSRLWLIETEVLPAITVSEEAASRLGKQLQTNGRMILSSVAIRLPKRLRTKEGHSLRDDVAKLVDLEMALYTGRDSKTASRWPAKGWMRGSVVDLSVITQSASVPPDVIDEAANLLVESVSDAAGMLADMASANPGAINKISLELRQEDGEQTRRMAATILANAFVFHETLAGGPGDLAKVNTLEQLRSSAGLSKSSVLAEWRKILKVNYWPIFDIARRILELTPAVAVLVLHIQR